MNKHKVKHYRKSDTKTANSLKNLMICWLSGERSLPFGLIVFNFNELSFIFSEMYTSDPTGSARFRQMQRPTQSGFRLVSGYHDMSINPYINNSYSITCVPFDKGYFLFVNKKVPVYMIRIGT